MKYRTLGKTGLNVSVLAQVDHEKGILADF